MEWEVIKPITLKKENLKLKPKDTVELTAKRVNDIHEQLHGMDKYKNYPPVFKRIDKTEEAE